MSERWEYKVVTHEPGWKGYDFAKLETELNELGAQGWRVVANLAPGVASSYSAKIGILLERTTPSF